MKILLIESQKELAVSISEALEKKGFDIDCLYDSFTVVRDTEFGVYDLLIIDSTVPGLKALEVIKRVRSKKPVVPIILLSDKDDVESRLDAYNYGADYYLPTPFDTRELIAMIKNLLRRSGKTTDTYTLGNTTLDLDSCALVNGNKMARLSAKEFDLMRLFFQSKNSVLSKEVILARVWGFNSDAVDNNVEVYIGFLRRKLQSIDSNVKITVLRRLGYCLEV